MLEDMEDFFKSKKTEETSSTKSALSAVSSILQGRAEVKNFYREDPILAKVEERISIASGSGLKYLRSIVDSELIQEAPAGYFTKYLPFVHLVASTARNEIVSEGELSKLLNEVRKNPTDESLEKILPGLNSIINRSISESQNKRELGSLSPVEIEILKVLVYNEIAGYSVIEPLWRDEKITEIACNGPFDIQVEIEGKMNKLPSISFSSQEHLESLLNSIYGAIGKEFTSNTNSLKGRFYDNSRIFCTGRPISPEGPNVSIRRHPKEYWSAESMVRYKAVDEEVMTFIGNVINKGGNAIIVGGTSSGKTSLFNALTGFYRDDARILTMEDNLEMKPNPKKLLAAPLECRAPNKEKPGDLGVIMRDLVKFSLQMKPHVILIGEITDGACYDLVQALNTGHYGASTIHSNNSKSAMVRLASLFVQSGMGNYEDAYVAIAEAFDIIINIRYFDIDGSRRVVSVDEVGKSPVVNKEGVMVLPTNQLYKFVSDGFDENGKIKGHYEKVGELSQERIIDKNFHLKKDKTWEELKEISAIPEGYLVK